MNIPDDSLSPACPRDAFTQESDAWPHSFSDSLSLLYVPQHHHDHTTSTTASVIGSPIFSQRYLRTRRASPRHDESSGMETLPLLTKGLTLDVDMEVEKEPFRLFSPKGDLTPSEAALVGVDMKTQQQTTGDVSVTHTVLNCINTMMGTGVLSLPYAFKLTGWIMGLVLLTSLLFITNYTAKVLRKTVDYHPKIKSFPDIGEAAFGLRGRYIISIMFYFELFCVSVMYILLAADNFNILFPDFGSRSFMIIFFVVLLIPSVSTSKLGVLSYFSLIGVIASLFLISVVVATGITSEQSPGSVWHPALTRMWPENWNEAMAGFGIVMVGFAGHACIPSIYDSMDAPVHYDLMVDVSWTAVSIVYTLLAVTGYMMYGDFTCDMITKNLDKGVAATLAVVLIIINPLTKFALTLNPIALSSEELTQKKFSGRLLDVLNILIRWLLTLLVALTAIMLPNFATIVGLIGSIFSFTVSIIFPCWGFLCLYWHDIRAGEKGMNLVLIIAGIIMAALGTYGTVCVYLYS